MYSKLFDFYFSESYDAKLKKEARKNKEPYYYTTKDGVQYNICVEAGHDHGLKFKDIVFVGSGNLIKGIDKEVKFL